MKRAMQGKAQVGFSYLPHIESYKYNNFISANQPMLPASHDARRQTGPEKKKLKSLNLGKQAIH